MLESIARMISWESDRNQTLVKEYWVAAVIASISANASASRGYLTLGVAITPLMEYCGCPASRTQPKPAFEETGDQEEPGDDISK